ncbi:hypothetical protein EVJ58_g10672 [Rhodofomes roseus]|uniref:Uncharacterized protein n=1 Tax=Rhodofomes roseus TaxID=34475 RepID=A0A4Y9XRT4_9APHY|nr:hypothetical protein EVJ58_g10672 [Rhodofomes roseus]
MPRRFHDYIPSTTIGIPVPTAVESTSNERLAQPPQPPENVSDNAMRPEDASDDAQYAVHAGAADRTYDAAAELVAECCEHDPERAE